jgi:hypothetical protein
VDREVDEYYKQRIAIARRLGHDVGANRAAGAAAVVDNERLAKIFREPGAQHARDKIRAAAGRGSDDQAYGLVGIGLTQRQVRQDCSRECDDDTAEGCVISHNMSPD